MGAYRRHVDEHFDAYMEELKRYLRQPSIAARGEGTNEAAGMTLELVRSVGAEARLIPISGGPPAGVHRGPSPGAEEARRPSSTRGRSAAGQ